MNGTAKHALLSASSAHRWLECTPSAVLESQFEDTETPQAAEGTAAHSLCEYKLKRMLKMQAERPQISCDTEEMEEATTEYAKYVSGIAKRAMRRDKTAEVFVEERVDFSEYVPDGFGTADAVLVAKGSIHIFDFKYGAGVYVYAEDNPQLKLYALGALARFADVYGVKKVRMTIYQPRMNNVHTAEISAVSLKKWGSNVVSPQAKKAASGEGVSHTGEWCRFCRVKHLCRARAFEMLDAAGSMPNPLLLTDDDIEALLPRLPEIKKWADDVAEYALNLAVDGKEWAGFKLSAGRALRKFSSEEDVKAACIAAGYKDIYKSSLLSVVEMEKLMGKKDFETILGGFVEKPEGKPRLVPAKGGE